MSDCVVGKPISEIETPALLIDLDVLESNFNKMNNFLMARPTKLRPHFKSVKITQIAKWQMSLGAKGITCAKLSEAYVLAEAGITDILIANQIIGKRKVEKLAQLARKVKISVAVDNADNIREISTAAQKAGSNVYLLVEIDVGMNRCGVRQKDEALQLADLICRLPGVFFSGLQAYEGHLVHHNNPDERIPAFEQVTKKIVEYRDYLSSKGITVNEISGGGTGTFNLVAGAGIHTELQAGSYIYMDARYNQVMPQLPFKNSLFVLAEIISHSAGMAIGDAGTKCLSMDSGSPKIYANPEAEIRFNEEHCTISDKEGKYSRGDRIKLIPGHCCTTINLFDVAYGIRNGYVENIFTVDGRGKSQ